MRLSVIFAITTTFATAAALSVVAAGFAVTEIEDASHAQVQDAFDSEDMAWTRIETDGLQVEVGGTAPSEAARFRALSVAGSAVDATRVIDQMQVEEAEDVAPPRFAMEILRNESGVSLIGLVPDALDRERLILAIANATGDARVADLLETADHAAPTGWNAALDFAVDALGDLPRAKISLSAERVEITATAESAADRRRLESDLARTSPPDVRLALDLSEPRPVITPFTLRFVLDDGGARFDACSADTEEARDRILGAAGRAGLRDKTSCTIGMGVPSPRWAEAAEMAIAAVDDLGGGTVTFTDADIALRAPEGTPADRFDDVVGSLESDLPEVFALKATRPEPEQETTPETPEFIATLSPEGQVLMRGQLSTPQLRETAQSFAKARFASNSVHMAARVAEGLPRDWPIRVLLGLEALSHLAQGTVTVTPDHVEVKGRTGSESTGSDLSGLLSDTLDDDAQFTIEVVYDESLDPAKRVPTPEQCEARIAEIQEENKIGFKPGSAQISPESIRTMDQIADVIEDCGELRMEIGGHTDSQGREEMNERLSLDRARAVLQELRMRRVLTSSIAAKGYGESSPIADNDSADGREANRRIEFRVIRPEQIVNYDTELEPPDRTDDSDPEDAPDPQDERADEQD